MSLGIIGGSGIYRWDDIADGRWIEIDTPYGRPSSPIFCFTEAKNSILFLARHGKAHSISPSEINYRANIWALKKLGATQLLSVSAVGSLREEIIPGDFVLPDQFIDVTKLPRARTFFEGGVVGHVPFSDPTCSAMRSALSSIIRGLNHRVHDDGTYVCIEGPQFSTRAESRLFKGWGASIIGMTAMPEARLAREAGMCYQTIATATDYDCWREAEESVTLEQILSTLKQNVEKSRRVLQSFLSSPLPACKSGCRELMKSAVITSKELWPKGQLETLSVVLN